MKQTSPTDPPQHTHRRVRVSIFIIGVILGIALVGTIAAINFNETTDPYYLTEGVHIDAHNGPEIRLGETIQIDRVHPVHQDTVNLEPVATITGDADTKANINGFEDTFLELSDVDLNSGALTVDAANHPEVTIQGGATEFRWRDYTPDDGNADLHLQTGGVTTMTLTGLPDADYITLHDDQGNQLDRTVPSGGEATLTTDASGDLYLQTATVEFSDPNPEDEVVFDFHGAIDLSVHIDHPAFDESDTVTVIFRDASDDSIIDQTTISETGRAEVTWDNPAFGGNEWYVDVDDNGDVYQSETWGFSVPQQLHIFNESAPSEYVDDIEVEVRFFVGASEELIVTRNATDGIINMTGLPTDQSFVVDARGDGYHPRRIYVESLFEQQSIFLLPTDITVVESVFTLEDYTGKFPSANTIIQIERALLDDWQTVEGDFFGAGSDFSSVLEYNERYQMTIINVETGETEHLGVFIPLTSGDRNLRITQDGEFEIDGFGALTIANPSIREVPATESASISVTLRPSHGELVSWSLNVTWHNDTQTIVLDEIDGTDPNGIRYEETFNMTGKSDGELTVNIEWEHEDGMVGHRQYIFNVVSVFDHDHSLLKILADITGVLPEDRVDLFTTLAAVMLSAFGTAAVAIRYNMSSEAAGLISLGLLGTFVVINWLPIAVLFAAGATFAAFAGVRRGV